MMPEHDDAFKKVEIQLEILKYLNCLPKKLSKRNEITLIQNRDSLIKINLFLLNNTCLKTV